MKQRSVVFSAQAESDLIDIYDWISHRAGPEVAMRYLARIEDYCATFAYGSERGTKRDDIRPGLRTVGFERRITIAFVVQDIRVIILRIYYGGRNWTEIELI